VAGLAAISAAYYIAWKRILPLGIVAVWTFLPVVVGIQYPCLGVNEIPANVHARLEGAPTIYRYHTSYPAFLGVRLERPIPSLGYGKELKDAVEEGAVVIVHDDNADGMERELAKLGYRWTHTVTEWQAFRTRKTFLEFTRKDVTLDDWDRAYRMRSLKELRSHYRAVTGFERVAKTNTED
jgi:hypothetical protein